MVNQRMIVGFGILFVVKLLSVALVAAQIDDDFYLQSPIDDGHDEYDGAHDQGGANRPVSDIDDGYVGTGAEGVDFGDSSLANIFGGNTKGDQGLFGTFRRNNNLNKLKNGNSVLLGLNYGRPVMVMRTVPPSTTKMLSQLSADYRNQFWKDLLLDNAITKKLTINNKKK